MTMRYLSCLLVSLLYCSSLPAQLFPSLGGQRAGISALTFLKVDLNPRSAALAGANLCLRADGYGAFANPATLSELDDLSISLAHNFWHAGVNYSGVSVVKPFRIGHLGLSMTGLSSGAMPVRTEFQPDGTGELFYASYFTAGLSYAKQLTDWFRYGFTLKYVREQLQSFTAQTATLDLGFLYRTDVKDLSFAVMVQNFGLNSTLKGSVDIDQGLNSRPRNLEDYPAPTVFKLGLSFIPWKSKDGHQQATAYAQLNHPNDNAENIRLGLEWQYRSLLFLRGGYRFNVVDQDYPTAGIGVRSRMGRHMLMLDYAIDPSDYVGIAHRLGLQVRFNQQSREE